MAERDKSWQPDRANLGNWEAMFQQRRQGASPSAAELPPFPAAADDSYNASAGDFISETYRPWVVQRGRAQPAMMLGLRRFDGKSGLWRAWALAYPTLVAVEALGDRMLNLDFGSRQFMLQGSGLDQLANDLQRGVVLGIVEYAAAVWPILPSGPVVTRIEPLDVRQT